MPSASTRVRWAAAGGLAGLAAGGLLFRWSSFWDWLIGADWSTLPATVVGTTIPAAAGVLFAQAFARRSVRTLHQAQLEAADDYERRRAAASAAEREARRALWDGVYDRCRAILDSRQANVPFEQQVFAAAREIDEASAAERKNAQRSKIWLQSRSGRIARYGSAWGATLRSELPSLIEPARTLVTGFGVDALRVPHDVLVLLLKVADDERRWIPPDLDTVLAAAQASTATFAIAEIGESAWLALDQLSRLAARQRSAPHDQDEIDPFVTVGWGDHQSEVNVLGAFAELGDLIEAELAREPG